MIPGKASWGRTILHENRAGRALFGNRHSLSSSRKRGERGNPDYTPQPLDSHFRGNDNPLRAPRSTKIEPVAPYRCGVGKLPSPGRWEKGPGVRERRNPFSEQNTFSLGQTDEQAGTRSARPQCEILAPLATRDHFRNSSITGTATSGFCTGSSSVRVSALPPPTVVFWACW